MLCVSDKVRAASAPVDGLFDITMGNRTLKDVNATITRAAMETLFNIEFKDYGCMSYKCNSSSRSLCVLNMYLITHELMAIFTCPNCCVCCLCVAFDISRAGSCRGHVWTVEWENTYGDQPLIQLSNQRLSGSSPNASVVTVVDGGVWIRPLRGDMLRLPERKPQVSKVPCSQE